MYAIIVAGGKQIRVSEGDSINTEKIEGEVGTKVEFPVIFKVDGENISTEAGVAKGEIVAQGRDKKIVVFKYKAKKNIRKKIGHRQYFTKVKILSI